MKDELDASIHHLRNVDAGTMNPAEHGEVFVTQDGAETDQFDRSDTVYVMVEDEAGNIAGCARLLTGCWRPRWMMAC